MSRVGVHRECSGNMVVIKIVALLSAGDCRDWRRQLYADRVSGVHTMVGVRTRTCIHDDVRVQVADSRNKKASRREGTVFEE